MKSRKYVWAVLSVMILLLFIGSASAADGNETDVLSIDESVSISDEKLALDSSIDNAVANDANVLRNNGNDLLSMDHNVKSNDPLKVSNDELLTAGNSWYVNANAASDGDGSKENPFKNFLPAVMSASDGDTILWSPPEHMREKIIVHIFI